MELYLQSLAFTANVVAPIFFIVLLGYLMRRWGWINGDFVDTASRLVFRVTLPALVFLSISRTDFHAVFNPQQLTFVFFSLLASYLLIWILASRWLKNPADHGVFVQGAFRSNYGIIGFAVAFNLYGQPGLAQSSMLAALVIPMFNLMSIIALAPAAHPGQRLGLGRTALEALKNPLILAVLFALPLSYFNLQLPELLKKTGNYFANLTLPLALLAIGGTLNLQSLRDSSLPSAWASGIKILLMPLLLTPLAWAFGFKGQDLALLFVLFACPTAAASFVMASAMGGNAQLAANIVLVSTLGSVLSLGSGIYLMRVLGLI